VVKKRKIGKRKNNKARYTYYIAVGICNSAFYELINFWVYNLPAKIRSDKLLASGIQVV
jgi:hypothetical protein